MKFNTLVLILAFLPSFAFSAGLPEFLNGPVWGHLASTTPYSEEFSSHPKRNVLGSIANGTLTFQSRVVTDFELSELGGVAEYSSKTEGLDVTILFRIPFAGLYTIIIKTPESYERYNLKIKK